MLKPLIHQARIAFSALFRLPINQSATENQTMFELETNFSPEVGISLPMYYAFYHQPLFRRFSPQNLDSEVFSSTKMNEWIHNIRLTPDDPRESSPEARAFSDLARNGNELIWTMTTLVAGLNVFLTSEAAVLVLSTAFSVRCDPQCVLPPSGTWSYPSKTHERYGFRLACATHPRSDVPSQVRLVFEKGSAKVLQRPRYGLDCTIGWRLAEDYALISHVANICGLQEESNRSVSCDTLTEQLKVNMTLILVALTSQALAG